VSESDDEQDDYFGPMGAPHRGSGRLEWIGVRPRHRAPVMTLTEARLEAGRGIEGDRVFDARHDKRQVTLIQSEHLAAVGALAGLTSVAPEQLRRNLVVSGINLQSLKNKCFRVGEVLLEGTGDCHPCSRMEENLGRGGYQAMRGHGGITARVVEGGVIRVGDAVRAGRR